MSFFGTATDLRTQFTDTKITVQYNADTTVIYEKILKPWGNSANIRVFRIQYLQI